MKYYRTIITYDAMGNPLPYRDGMKMTWQNGRKLTSLKTKNNSITYKYDSNGLLTQKDDKNYTTYLGIRFNDSGMYYAFKNKWNGTKQCYLEFFDYCYMVILVF